MLIQLARNSSKDKDRRQGPAEERGEVVLQEQAALVVQARWGERGEELWGEGDLGVVSREVKPEEEWEVSGAEV